ncbi:ABC transporter ATP-binding protein [Oleisolibacter albus]|uniref:ABC transporter ATP-binding protein n=1 Tax=Oleisolibacter albus TaxID=2171757 RepID=UPI000DF424F3|nr:sn-glycerol-3-phosphate ABC transporter ATP-binding protein UgpC [Oleisolibacter albus]
MSAVELKGVEKQFGKTNVIRGVDLSINSGEFIVFVGPSGCGKSTLLRLVAGLEEPTGGQVRIGDQVVNDKPPSERGIAMVFQSYALYPHMTARENMAFGLKLGRMDKAGIDSAVNEAARILQIEHLLGRKPRELSGGQRQRVAIGRALVRHPKVFLFDEPLSNLDAALRVQTRLEIARLHRNLKATMIYVTHDQVEAMTLADRIVVLNAGQVEQVGSPLELYENPSNQFVAGFIGSPSMNFIPVTMVGQGVDGVSVTLPGEVTATVPVIPEAVETSGDRLVLGVRPEHLLLGDAEPGVPSALIAGRALLVEQLGESGLVHVRLEDGSTLAVRQPGTVLIEENQPVQVVLPLHRLHLFDESGRSFRRQRAALSQATDRSTAISAA